MRTVSFSSPSVKRQMNKDFVCLSINTEGDPSAGSSQAHAPGDRAGRCAPGIGNQNVQTVFLTPEGQIFHTASGFQDGPQLVREMDFATNLFRKLKESPELAEQTVRTDHHQRMLKAGYSPQQLQQAASRSRFPFGRNPFTSAQINGTGNSPFNIFSAKTERSRMLDYEFSQKYAMLEWDQFERNPRLLVGDAVTAFASGNASGGKIGGNSSPNSSSVQNSQSQQGSFTLPR